MKKQYCSMIITYIYQYRWWFCYSTLNTQSLYGFVMEYYTPMFLMFTYFLLDMYCIDDSKKEDERQIYTLASRSTQNSPIIVLELHVFSCWLYIIVSGLKEFGTYAICFEIITDIHLGQIMICCWYNNNYYLKKKQYYSMIIMVR